MIIGVDPHKSTHAATAVDAATNTVVASVRARPAVGVVESVALVPKRLKVSHQSRLGLIHHRSH